jgi:hypothetical protein
MVRPAFFMIGVRSKIIYNFTCVSWNHTAEVLKQKRRTNPPFEIIDAENQKQATSSR